MLNSLAFGVTAEIVVIQNEKAALAVVACDKGARRRGRPLPHRQELASARILYIITATGYIYR